MQYAIGQLSRAVAAPTNADEIALKRCIRYLSQTKDLCLHLEPSPGPLKVEAWADSDWAGNADRRSCSGGLLCVNGAVVLSWARTQGAYALSSCEAELYSIGSAAS